MKKTLTAIIAAVLLTGCGGYKPAEDNKPAESTPETSKPAETPAAEPAPAEETRPAAALTFEYPESGFALELPESFTEINGYFDDPKDYGELEIGSGIVYGSLNLYLRSPEEKAEYDAMLASIKTEADITDEVREKMHEYSEGIVQVYSVIGVNGGRTYKDIEHLATDASMIKDEIEIGECDGYRYYSIILDLDHPQIKEGLEKLNQESVQRYKELLKEAQEHPEYIVPKKRQPSFVAPEIGTEISFEGKDLNGNPVSSKDLFAQNDITMINIWRTWCSVCIDEFPAVNELAKTYADKKVGVVTYCADTTNEELTNKAINIIKEYDGLTTNLAYDPSIDDALPWLSTPLTYFVDREGKILCYPIKGAAPQQYPEYLDKLLNNEPIVTEFSQPATSASNTYTVLVADQNSEPVPGAIVGFCTDANCNIAQADTNGFAIFSGPQYPYHVKIIEVPEGYSYDEDYADTMDTDGGSVIISVVKN